MYRHERQLKNYVVGKTGATSLITYERTLLVSHMVTEIKELDLSEPASIAYKD